MSQRTSTSQRYTISICKGSAFIEETKTLLRAWHPTETLGEFRERVLREDLLGKKTAYRTNDIVRRVFARRLLTPDNRPALLMKRLLAGKDSARLVSDLLLLYAARNDETLRDVIVKLYWPTVREGSLTLNPGRVVAFLQEAEAKGKMSEPWSEQVKLRVARGLLKALLDFGLLKEVSRGRRETVYFHVTDGSIVYLAYDLHFSGLSDAAVVGHLDWGLYGLRNADVPAALDRLSSEGWWLAQSAGSVTRISWKFPAMEEVINVLAR